MDLVHRRKFRLSQKSNRGDTKFVLQFLWEQFFSLSFFFLFLSFVVVVVVC